MNKIFTEKDIAKYTKQAQKYINNPNWREAFGFLEPKAIDWQHMQEVQGNELYLSCICHYPDCPTMKEKQYIPIRYNKLNGYEQVSCRACAKKAKAEIVGPKPNYQIGDIVCDTQKLIHSLTEKEKHAQGISSHAKYWQAKCTVCGRESLIHNDMIYNKSAHCPCQSMSNNERKIYNILSQWKAEHPNSFNFDYEYKCGDTRLQLDFVILDKNNQPFIGIEYDGEYHDMIEESPNGIQIQQMRDKRKDQFCRNNNIKLLRIHHTEQNLITSEWLKEKLKNL